LSSKGGRQAGTSGFLFGTTRAFRPHHRNGHPIKILELPYAVINPGVITPESVILPIVETVRAVNGCLHATFELHAVKTPAGTAGLKRLMALAKQSGSEFMTMKEMIQFEDVRRGITLELKLPGQLIISSPIDYNGLTLLVAAASLEVSGMVSRSVPQKVSRYGTEWIAVQLNVPCHRPSTIRLYQGNIVQVPVHNYPEISQDNVAINSLEIDAKNNANDDLVA